MSNLTEQQREEIIKIFSRSNPDRMFLFDKIPEKRLMNAKKRFGQMIEMNEEVIFLLDESSFRTGRDGMMITPLGIYAKAGGSPPFFVSLSEVKELEMVQKKSIPELHIHSHSDEVFKISIIYGKKTAFNIIDEIILFLQGKQQRKEISDQNRCSNCGAPKHSSDIYCEYCGVEFG